MTHEYLVTEHYCRNCGRPFRARQSNASTCSARCKMAAWRAVSMLAGTHGWVDGQFRRLPGEQAAA